MLKFKKLWKAWCEIEGEPRLPIPVCAKPRSLRIDKEFIWLEFPQCPEASALMQGVKFELGPSFTGNFVCNLSTTTGALKTASGSGGYSIDANDLQEASFRAYIAPPDDSKEAIVLAVVPEITGASQVKLSPGNQIEISRNLIGQAIKVQAIYPHSVMLSQEKIETLYLHLVGLWENDETYYVGMSGCSMEVVGNLLKLRLGDVKECRSLRQENAIV